MVGGHDPYDQKSCTQISTLKVIKSLLPSSSKTRTKLSSVLRSYVIYHVELSWICW